MRPPVILKVYKNNQLKEVKQFTFDQIVLGSNSEAQLCLADESISPIHCLIESRENGYFVCDLGSQSGTFKNGQAVLDEQILSGDELIIGHFKVLFYVGIPRPSTKILGEVSVVTQVAAIESSNQENSEVTTLPLTDHSSNSSKDSIIQNKELKSDKPLNISQNPKSSTKVNKQLASDLTNKKISKPNLQALSSQVDNKNKKTFAPPTQIESLKSYLSPTKGGVVEVNVIWNERIVQSYHFRHKGVFKAGKDSDKQLHIPSNSIPNNWPLLEVSSVVKVLVPTGSEYEVITAKSRIQEEELIKNGKAQRMTQATSLKLDQGEVLFITLPDKNIGLAVRFVENTGVVPFAPLLLTGSEMGSIILALIISGMLAFYVTTMSSKAQPLPEEDKTTYTAQVLFNETKVKEEKIPPPPPPPPPPKEEVKVKPPEPPKQPEKVKMADQNKEATQKGKTTNQQKAEVAQVAKKASEVAPIPNSQNKQKKFTSTKQGGAVKIGAAAGANAQSDVKDINKVGLFSAFGSGGVRSKLDQAYQGAGDILGNADKATGSTGFGEDRPGDDLGSKFKDTGRGGKGTATEGIAGIGTKGRGGGTSAYGSTDGFGDKTSVAIQAGGSEESFEGSIDKEAVRRRIKHNLNLIRGCYNQELNRLDKLGRRSLEGKVVLKWDIVTNGVAKNVRVASSTLNNVEIEKCIAERLATIVFPDPPKDTTAEVMYPFVFKNDK
ncbi:MAG: AgmX/PglI C-terminal domain-containing protein [Bdellovibrionaceae bacterium]|nr:AgmX/PglI C-terminal domain-containing protein [Pseudobdellovibrionaceae bacterium]NUM57083.1 AgmX/PglI C-terminal domain-containing protein [Pseudobdellovibrionaceae bacterium]